MAERIVDSSWVRNVFGLSRVARDRRNNSTPITSANLKFADTSFGGNQSLNPPPQSCRFADLKATGLLSNPALRTSNMSDGLFENDANAGSFRMGRHYSETHDDNAVLAHFRFGVAKYTGTIAFFANMYNVDAARLAKTGEYSSVMRSLGGAVGLAAMFVVIPFGVIVPLILASKVLKYAVSKRPSRYYYMKPTMNLYLQAVQAMADTQLMYHNLIPMWEPFNQDRYNEVGDDTNLLTNTVEEVYGQLPSIWKSNGKFDIYKAVNRYQTLANYQAKTLEEIYKDATDEADMNAKLTAYINTAKTTNAMKDVLTDDKMSLQALAMLYANNPLYQINEADEKARAQAYADVKARYASEHGISADGVTSEQDTAALGKVDEDGRVNPDQTTGDFWSGITDFWDSAGEQFGAELKDGGQWITFKIDTSKEIADSFSNTSRDPDIASTMNSMTSKARSLEVSTSGGNTGFDFIDGAVKGVKEFIAGGLDTLNIAGLAAIYGSSYIDIPEVWESSSASVGTESMTIQLRSPYGNDMSIFQNITLPLCFLLAGALPLASGKQTHTSPFLCEMYCRGRQNIRLGMIESISITRGVGNLGWRPDGKMLACDVTITVKDLSKVMSMPVVRDPSIFDDDNKYTDYMATIGGASLHQMTYTMDKMVFNLNKWKQSWKSAFSSGRITNSISNSAPARVLAALSAAGSR